MDWFITKDWNNKPYRISKAIILITTFLYMIVGVLIFVDNGFSLNDRFYAYCPEGSIGQCFNGFYNHSKYCGNELSWDSRFCSQMFLLPGESIGDKPSWIVENFSIIVFAIFILGLLSNHLIFNKGFFKGEKLGEL